MDGRCATKAFFQGATFLSPDVPAMSTSQATVWPRVPEPGRLTLWLAECGVGKAKPGGGAAASHSVAFPGSSQSTELCEHRPSETRAEKEANGAEGRHENHQAEARPETRVEPAELLMMTVKGRHHTYPMEGARRPGVA